MDLYVSLSVAAPEIFEFNTPDWNNIEATKVVSGAVLSKPTQVSLYTTHGKLLIEFSTYGVRLRSAAERAYDYGLIINHPELNPLSLESTDHGCIISDGNLSLLLDFSPFAFTLNDVTDKRISQSPSDGHFVRRHRVPPLAKTSQGWVFSVDLKSNEAIYGLGEKWGALNKRGQLIRSYNADALGVNAEVSYKNTPFVWSPEGWGVFSHTPSIVLHSVGHPSWSQRAYITVVEDDCLDLFLFASNSCANDSQTANPGMEIIRAYTDLTGSAPMPPNWSGGVILSKAYYQDPAELLAVAHQVRDRNMPCDIITIDGRAWQDTDTRFAFEWDKSRWPDPKRVLDELKKLGFKVCIWEYPLISVNHDLFKKFDQNGWLLKDKRNGETYLYDWDQQAFGEVLSPLPKSGIVDFTHPDAYDYWKQAHKALFDIGVDMIKSDFGEQLEDNNMLAYNGETGDQLHNVYGFLYNRCVYEAAEKYSKNGPFLFSRVAWTGCQRFNSQWGGDPQADWEGMIGNIRGGLSWGLSGGPFYATDIGGFYKDTRDDALYVRWAQAAVFSAHFRLHGIGPREPWSYSDAANEAVMQALDLRYRLQAYLQKTMRQSVDQSVPVQRPMVLALPQEKQSWAFENQFMFGDDLLVVPCFDPCGSVEFYLPKGDWLRFNISQSSASESLTGSKVYQQTLTLNEIAVFVRKGTQIPLNAKALNTVDIPQSSDGVFEIDGYWPVN
ncbi:MAG: alpha-D-xyloside xylohydrolase [Arenicella sp.]